MCSGEVRERKQVLFPVSQQLCCFRVNALQHANYLCALGVNVFGVGLAENRPDQGRNHFLPALRECLESVAEEMNPTPLPRAALQGHLDSGLQAFVCVRDDQVNTVKTPVSQLGEELSPEGFSFTVAKINTHDFGSLLSLSAHQPEPQKQRQLRRKPSRQRSIPVTAGTETGGQVVRRDQATGTRTRMRMVTIKSLGIYRLSGSLQSGG